MKGNLILGGVSGKLGDVVAYVNNGKQCARVRRRTIANPNSAGQQVQRMIMNTASQAVSAMRPILNNGFESVQKGAPSLAYARKLYMQMLRTENMFNTDNGLRYTMKGKKYMAPNAYMVSEGRLPGIYVSAVSADGAQYASTGVVSATATLADIFPQVEPGQQVTFFAGGFEVSNEEIVRQFTALVSVVFKDKTTPIFVASDANFKLNAAALLTEYTQGNINYLVFTDDHLFYFMGEALPVDAAFATIVVSERTGSQRSTSFLVPASDLPDITWSPDAVVDTYDNNGVDSGAPAEYYLDQNP